MKTVIPLTEDEAYELGARLRAAGYAVVMFSPSELAGADPDAVTNRLVELGNEVIDALADAGPE